MAFAVPLNAAEVARADLKIVGVSLEVDTRNPIATGIDIPAVVQTIFGGFTNDAAPSADGMTAVAELTGPGIDVPITVHTIPGHQFILPPLHQPGQYTLQNVRLVGADGGFLQQATPAFVPVTVSDILQSTVTVRQLTPEELRQRGISIDQRNYDVYEYTFVFGIHDQFVQIPYSVAIDRRTHETITLPKADPYQLPTPKQPGPPPRFQPPQVIGGSLLEIIDGDGGGPPGGGPGDSEERKRKPVIPAAIVLPTGFGVLHQFFAVILNISNNAPAGSSIQLDSISATMDTPLAMRVAKSNPSVAIGQAIPIHDKLTGATFLIAQGEANADWSLEALKAGTHTVTVNLRATYRNPGQKDVAMSGSLPATIVVSDPRFQINFVHPDVVRSGEKYTAYAFVTNNSSQPQTLRIDTSEIPACGSGFSGNNVCRTEGDGITNLTLAPGEMKPVPYKLTSKITGRIFAAAGNADEGITLGVSLTMGVSSSGIPLSPATLLLPHYAQYVNQDYVNAQLGILGLGFSLATAPSNRAAAFPPVIKDDVFRRAQDIARAGERIFVARRDASADDPAEDREPVYHLSLDQLGNIERVDALPNTADLKEWDQLRRQEEDGRSAAAAMTRELERVGLAGGRTVTQFVDDFAAATSHRTAFVLAVVHGAQVQGNDRPYAITLNPDSVATKLAIPSEATAGWVRHLPFAELDKFNVAGESAELAMVGRWTGAIDLQVASASSQYTVELIYPDAAEGVFLRTSFVVSNASATTPLKLRIDRGARVMNVTGATASPVIGSVVQTPLRIVGAAQDLFLDGSGHIVTLLFNRPVNGGDPLLLRNAFALTTNVAAANYTATRRNKPSDPDAPVVIPGAAITDDRRMINVTFDKTLSSNALYTLAVDPVADLLTPSMSVSGPALVPRIDNKAPGGIVYGKVLRGDNSELSNVLVQLDSGPLPSQDGGAQSSGTQFDTTLDHGDYLFEFIPRDIDRGASGAFTMKVTAEGKFTQVDGVVRLPGEAQRINIVFLGLGTVNGHVRYSDGTVAKNAIITIGNTKYNTFSQEFRRGITGAAGEYNIADVPVGPLTIAAQDEDGNVVYAANQIRVPGEALTQDLVFQKRELAGFATVRVTVRRSDIADPAKAIVPNAHVGVYTQGYGLLDGFTDSSGQFTFSKVPAGFISLLAAEFSITRESAGIELDLRPDTTIDQVLTLHVPTPAEQAAFVTVAGTVWRDDPTAPGNPDRDVRVKNAVITVRGFVSVTADDQGNYSYSGIPTSLSDKRVVDVLDPQTGRTGTFAMPTLQPGTNQLKLRLSTTVPQGLATLRVRLLDAAGNPVSGYRVIWPGFPADEFAETGNGIYEMKDRPVPISVDAWAVAVGHPKYGDQTAHGTVHADFDGQIATLELRLPGQGTILGRMEVRKPCPAPPAPCVEQWDPAFGPMSISYPVWDEAEQELKGKERVTQADTVTGVTTIAKVPVGYDIPVETVEHPAGFASSRTRFAYDGQTQSVTLRLSSLGDVTGRVLSYDGQTPVPGASVRLLNDVATYAPVTTGPDGTFKFAGVPANAAFTVVAEATQDGVYRTGFVEARTPVAGGPVGGLAVIMRQQGKIEGNVVDLSGNPVPLAQYWVRELAWPHRSFGSAQSPLNADRNGHFVLTNLFVGGFRVSAKSPGNQEVRGDAQGEIRFESDNQTNVVVRIGGAGTGSVSVTVVDSNTSFARVPNAEVTLMSNGSVPFDFATTDLNGSAFFDQVPVGTYGISATAKAVARTGSSDPFSVTANVVSPVQVTLTFLGKVTGTLT
ncbi:MAG: carboxypeptidase-like regulatory domain-containing protein, partial [Acidobacteriota bacterium]